MHFHWNALIYFREAAQKKSMRKAAESLDITPSAVNRQIIKLEAQMKCQLFERSAEGVSLTAAGETFYRYVQQTHHGMERMLSEIEDLRGIRRGHVTIACEEGLGKDFLPRVIASFSEQYPGVSFSIKVTDMPSITEGVAQGEYDIGLAFDPLPHPQVQRRKQVSVSIGVVMLPAHRLSMRKSLRLADLVGEPLIIPDGGYAIRQMLDRQFANESSKPLSMRVESNSFETINALVKMGMGSAVRTRVGILGELERSELVFVPLTDAGMHTDTIAICTKRRRPLPVAPSILIERLISGLSVLAG
ncbi:LysR family transcriptional regulator [Variovorax ginsengisoli]|uniref:DNA-binding transcriptional LysR family regulator n=1 Tax=Variovorax ginsengisoli TaxID=363844 RepID=A0ABT9SBX6_9BURK|nr:LysR family transcriptional regulator [Variovorax ginsengisoli]MDP9901856.1 DNA-binding transcriptional LysR family regulator [Variovorax ginsengisoli]